MEGPPLKIKQESFEALAAWLLFDVVCDSVYLLDLMWYKHRLMFIENGFWVRDRAKITQHYIRRGPFLYDLLALLPTGKVSFKISTKNS